MAQVNIAELATEGISLSDFFAKANTAGIASKNTIQNLMTLFETVGEVGFKGEISAGTYATKDAGWYFATNTGDYIMGSTTISVDVSDTLTIIIVPTVINDSSKVEVPISITIDAVPTDGSTSAVQSNGVFDALALKANITSVDNYPYTRTINPTGSGSKLSLLQCQEFVIDLQIFNDFDVTKKYSISTVVRNLAGLWRIRIAQTDLDGTTGLSEVLQFTTNTNPELTGMSKHTLTSFNNSFLKGEIIVDWSKVPDGSNFFSMTPVLGYELDKSIFKGYSPNYTSKALTQDKRVLEEGAFLTAKQVDEILISLNLKNTDNSLNYGLSVVAKGYTVTGDKNRIDIFSINDSNVITQFAIYRNNDVDAKTGVEEIELLSATGVFLGTAIVDWDKITSNTLYNLGTSTRALSYVFRRDFYKNESNDLSIIVKNYDTVFDAVQDNVKGKINVGLSRLQSYDNATSKDDFLNINGGDEISDLFDFSYINTFTARLLLIDSKKIMWWRLATNAGVQIFTCTIDEFKNALTDMPDVGGEKRKQIETYTVGFAPTFLTLFQTLNIGAIRESEGRYVASDTTVSNPTGNLYYLNPSTNQFVASTIPTDGRKGDCRSTWGFDFYKNYAVINGYNLTRGLGRLLFSSDYGVTYTTIFDVETTGNLTNDERPDSHLHGCFIDKYNNNRVYLVIGDQPVISGTGKVFYTDNPTAGTPAFTKMVIDFVGSSEPNEQYISGFATKENVLFGSDMRNNSIMRMNKLNNTHSKRELAVLLSELNTGVVYTPQGWSRWNNKDILVCFNGAGDLASSENIPAQIYATMDGIKFFKIWEDTVFHSAFFSINGITQAVEGELYSFFNEGTNARFANGNTLLLGKYQIL